MLKLLGGGGAAFIQGGTSIPESRVDAYSNQNDFINFRPHCELAFTLMCQPKPIKLINKLGAKNESPLGPLQYNVCKQITLLLHCSPHAFTNFLANGFFWKKTIEK